MLESFFLSESFVFLWLALVVAVAYGLFYYGRSLEYFTISLYIVSCLMFGYSIVPVFLDNSRYWFDVVPPFFVSRIVFVYIVLACVFLIIYGGNTFRCYPLCENILGISFLAVPLSLHFLWGLRSSDLPSEALRAHLTFSVVLSGYFLIVYAVLRSLGGGFLFAKKSYAVHVLHQIKDSVTSVQFLIFVCVIVFVVFVSAFFQVAYDLEPIRNFFNNKVETRATSSFHNPNWFALSVGLVIFFGCYVLFRRRIFFGCAILSMSFACLIFSGSRSATLLSIICGFITVFLLFFSSREFRLSQFLAMIFLSALMAIFLPWIAMIALGQVAVDRYVALLERVLLWVFHLSTESVSDSIYGRLSVAYFDRNPTVDGIVYYFGRGVIDNAYIYLSIYNPLQLFFLYMFMCFCVLSSISTWCARKSCENGLLVSLSIYVALSGVIGQVYWAFPLWIALAIANGVVLAGVRFRG